MKLSRSFSGALRTFAYFMASGTQNTLKGIDYLELDENGDVLNAKYAEKRATDYLRAYCDRSFVVSPPYEDWEMGLYEPPPLKDLI
jgi:hypothetical protein